MVSIKAINNLIKVANKFTIKKLAAYMTEEEAKKILGISGKYTQEELSKIFKKKVIQFHPDVNKSPEATDQMKKINMAYERLRQISKPETAFNPGEGVDYGYYSQKDEPEVDIEDHTPRSYEDMSNKEYPKFTVQVVVRTGPVRSGVKYERCYWGDEDSVKTVTLSSIEDAVKFINGIIDSGRTNLFFLISEKKEEGYEKAIGFVKPDLIDKRWYYRPGFLPNAGDIETPEKNFNKSWNEVSPDLINQYSKKNILT